MKLLRGLDRFLDFFLMLTPRAPVGRATRHCCCKISLVARVSGVTTANLVEVNSPCKARDDAVCSGGQFPWFLGTFQQKTLCILISAIDC